MNRDVGGKPGRRASRQITAEEAQLWHQLSGSIEKIKTKPRVTSHGGDPTTPTPRPPRPAHRPAAPQAARPHVPAPPTLASPPSRAPLPTELDRRTARQVAAGKVSIDGVLDLHGLHQDSAHRRLRAFLMSSRAKGHRMVLVITGKGAGAAGHDAPGPAPRGVLRRSVPLWLEEPELRAIVLGYASAGVRHGGDGALYIRLRKAREA